MPSLVEIRPFVLEKIMSLFPPLGKGVDFHLNKLKSSWPKNWYWTSGSRGEGFKMFSMLFSSPELNYSDCPCYVVRASVCNDSNFHLLQNLWDNFYQTTESILG